MKGWVWRLYLGAGGQQVVDPGRQRGGAQAVLNLVVGASSVAAIAAGIALHRPGRRLAWWLIAGRPGPVRGRRRPVLAQRAGPGHRAVPLAGRRPVSPRLSALATGLALLALSRSAGHHPGTAPGGLPAADRQPGATFAADMAFSVLALQGTATTVTDGGYLVADLLLGASALHPSLPALSGTVLAPRARLGRGCSSW
jgi:hypothetical protein